MRAGVALGLHDVDAGGDAIAVEHVGPFEPVELRSAQTGVEGDRIRRRSSGSSAASRAAASGTSAERIRGFSSVEWEFDEAKWIPLDEPATWRGRPGVHARGERDQLRDARARQAMARELVDPALPVHL